MVARSGRAKHFYLCSRSQSMRRAVVLALDFDRTLTVGDTLHAVAAVAASRQPTPSRFPWCASKYAAEYAAFEAKWQPSFPRPPSARPPFPRLLNAYVESLRRIEERSLHRIAVNGVLARASRADFAAAGRRIELQPGAADAVNGFLRDPNFHVCVVSANWSRDFIRGALEAAGVGLDGHPPPIFSNDPEFSPDTGLSTGAIWPEVVVASDKAAALARVTDKVALSTGAQPAIVYAGDSLTDLPVLLRADLGLLVGHDKVVDAWCQLLDVPMGRPGYRGRVLRRLDSWHAARGIVDSWADSAAQLPTR